MLFRTLARLGVSAFLFIPACSAKSTGHPATSETSAGGILGGGVGSGGVPGDGGARGDGAADDAGTCGAPDISNAIVVGQQQVAEAPPIPVGGSIADGTYVLVKDTLYTGPSGVIGPTPVTRQEIQVFAGTAVHVASKSGPSAVVDASGSFATGSLANDAGTRSSFSLTFAFTCPSSTTVASNYSVVGGQLLEFIETSRVLTYTRE